MSIEPKQKVTLSIDPEIVAKAKKLGINLSKISEMTLSGIDQLQDKNILEKDKLYAAYGEFFVKIKCIMEKFDCGNLQIGSAQVESDSLYSKDYYLSYTGKFFCYFEPSDNVKEVTLKEIPLYALPNRPYQIREIITKLIEQIYRENDEKKELYSNLKLFSRMLEVITEETARRDEKKE